MTLILRELGEPARGRWSNGMVGSASVSRLLQMAAEKMRADPAVLGGEVAYYEDLAVERRRDAGALTTFYSGKGPRPRTEASLGREVAPTVTDENAKLSPEAL